MDENEVYDSDNTSENDSSGESSDGENEEEVDEDETSVNILNEVEKAEQQVEKLITNEVDLMAIFEDLINPLYQDISAMFADGVPFFIDGDGLMIMLMSDNQWCNQLNGSSLHLIYLIENFLNIFVERGGSFHLIFFDSWKNVWEGDHTILLYRQIFIEHFTKNSNFNVHILDHCFNENFMDLISTLRPQFILSNLDIVRHCSIGDQKLQKRVEKTLFAQILYCLSIDLPCVDCNHIHTEIFTVFAFYTIGSAPISKLVTRDYERFKSHMSYPVLDVENIDTSAISETDISDVRILITVLAAKRFSETNKDKQNLLKIFLLTSAIMDSLNLENRSCPKFALNEEILKFPGISEWHKCLYDAISSISTRTCNWHLVSDLWQGLLFGHVCRFLQTTVEDSTTLGVTISSKYEQFISTLKTLGVQLDAYPVSSTFMNITWEGNYELPNITLGETTLLCIDNPLVTEFCQSVMHNIKWMEPPLDMVNNSIYTEEHHYHSMRVISDEHDRIKNTIEPMPADFYARRKYLRNKAKHARYMTIYGTSIEGRMLKSESVVRASTKENKKEKKCKTSKKAQAIIDKNINKKLLDQESTERTSLANFEAEYKKSKKNLDSLLNSLDLLIHKTKVPSVTLDCQIWKIKILLRKYKEVTSKKVSNGNNSIKRDIFVSVKKALSLTNSNLQLKSNQKEILSEGLQTIDCCEIAKRNNLPLPTEKSGVDNYNWIRYQLKCLGPDLERISDGSPDNRVKGFIPDNWQRELFNIVDKRQSAVIVAPTSSGKTYASYYCMESVLKEGTEGVVVYVSPTKALVNQVAATVYARFKNTIMPAGQSVYGIFTRDFRTYATNCQILITVPQCLELLLMSPRRYEWVKRLRYVIFDEVHCITGNMGGVSWERCLMLIRCPFLALSATIRHPDQLHAWLQEAEDYKKTRDTIIGDQRPNESYRVRLVVHSERHSDLTKYNYSKEQFHHLHPYANLEKDVMKLHDGIPSHVHMSPSETLELYEAMLNSNPILIQQNDLCVETYFSKHSTNGFLTRNIVREYEKQLSALLTKWYRENYNDYCNTINYLKPKQSAMVLEQNDIDYILKNFVKLVLTLREQNMLPAIIFSYNRNLVQVMTREITRFLMKSDVVLDRRTEKKINKEEKIKKKIEQRIERKEDPSKTVSKGNKNKDPVLNILQNNVNTLREMGTVDSGDIQFIEDRLSRMGLRSSNIFIEGLRHGVSMHHSGLNNKLRSAVEMLFRMKVLNIVFATGTLALGIHMPCKTTVIAGNSPFLNSLEYHQMSGRAGRRGFDTAGNVIFFGLNQRKQHTLLTAHLPSIQGSFPLNISFVLRLMLLVSDVTDRGKPSELATKVTVSRVLTLLENSLVYRQRPKMREQMKHFFSYSLQFLIMQEYITSNGVPLKWCGLATHLHYHEPGNLALVYLLRTGALRRLCSQGKSEEIQHKLVVILCYLFTKIPIKKYIEEKEFVNSKVILDPLPDIIEDALTKYNNEVNFVFNQYFASVATHCADRDITLPLSNVEINTSRIIEESQEPIDCLHTKFLNLCNPTVICSSFAALTGNNDRENIYTKANVINNIKRNVCHDVNVVPTIDIRAKLNGYPLDFFRHGIIKAIMEDNGLRAGEEFSLLQDFMLLIRTIKISLEEMQIVEENDPVYKHFKLLDTKYAELFQTAFPSYNY